MNLPSVLIANSAIWDEDVILAWAQKSASSEQLGQLALKARLDGQVGQWLAQNPHEEVIWPLCGRDNLPENLAKALIDLQRREVNLALCAKKQQESVLRTLMQEDFQVLSELLRQRVRNGLEAHQDLLAETVNAFAGKNPTGTWAAALLSNSARSVADAKALDTKAIVQACASIDEEYAAGLLLHPDWTDAWKELARWAEQNGRRDWCERAFAWAKHNHYTGISEEVQEYIKAFDSGRYLGPGTAGLLARIRGLEAEEGGKIERPNAEDLGGYLARQAVNNDWEVSSYLSLLEEYGLVDDQVLYGVLDVLGAGGTWDDLNETSCVLELYAKYAEEQTCLKLAQQARERNLGQACTPLWKTPWATEQPSKLPIAGFNSSPGWAWLAEKCSKSEDPSIWKVVESLSVHWTDSAEALWQAASEALEKHPGI